MVTITIFHASERCPKCERAEEIVHQIAGEFSEPADIRLKPVSDAPPEFGVIMPPAVFVGDRAIVIGGIPRKDDLRQVLSEQFGNTGTYHPENGPHSPEDEDQQESAFGHGQAVIEGDIAYVCAEDFSENSGCEPMLLFWYVEESDAVEGDDELAEIESAKAVFVITSPATGIVDSIFVTGGQPVQSNQRLAAIRLTDTEND